MKKITLFIFAIIAFSFASRKKNYTCECIKSGSITVNITVTVTSPASKLFVRYFAISKTCKGTTSQVKTVIVT